jgi:hypothetical protein
MNAKELVSSALRGRKIPRPPLIPFLGTYLTRVDQISMKELWQDPGRLHLALKNTRQLLNLDAVVMPIDHTLEAEGFGVQVHWDSGKPELQAGLPTDAPLHFDEQIWTRKGRIKVALEAVHRFSQTEGKQIPIFAVVSSPMTIWSKIFGGTCSDLSDEPFALPHMETLTQAVIVLCRSYAEAGADGIILNEEQNGDFAARSGIYKPIFNVIRHFNRLGVFRLPNSADADALSLSSVGADAYILPYDSFRKQERGAVGISLPPDFWNGKANDSQLSEAFAKVFQYKGLFLTTASPLDQEEIDLYDLQDRIEEITAESYWNC